MPLKVQGFLDGMGARRTTEQVRTLLVTALGDAERLGLVAVNAARRTEAPYRDAPKRSSFTLEDAKAMLEATAGSKYGKLYAVALWTGLRRGELCGLRWEDVNLGEDAPAITVRRQVVQLGPNIIVQEAPKTEAGAREVPLVPPAVAAFKARRAALARESGATPATGWVFPGPDRTAPMKPNHVSIAFGKKARALGFRDLPLHSLRHTTASLLLSAGVPAEQAAKIMGHKSLAVFYRTYADLLRPAAQDAAARLARYLEAQEKAPEKAVAGAAPMSAKPSAKTSRAPGIPTGSTPTRPSR